MTILFVACGALAREVIAIRDQHQWDAKILALPALLHNTPDQIPDAVAQCIAENEINFERVIVVYGDCGTGGTLARQLADTGIEMISGPHCYEMYAGAEGFAALSEQELGTFYLTDYLVQSFDKLVIKELGLDRYPELHEMYFAHYTRVVYLQQRHDPSLVAKAHQAAKQLGLPLEHRFTGYGELELRLIAAFEHTEKEILCPKL